MTTNSSNCSRALVNDTFVEEGEGRRRKEKGERKKLIWPEETIVVQL
jgi:hypothetical protein